MNLPPNSLPLRVLFAPGHPRLAGLKCPVPDSDILFLGRESIFPTEIPTMPARWDAEMRETLDRIRKSRYLKGNEEIVVLGCERYRDWIKKYPKQRERIDLMLTMIQWGMKGAYGLDVPFAYSGPEDATWGDLYTPMIGEKTRYSYKWAIERRVLPFISPIYGASIDHAASIVTRLALGPGLPHGACLWVQAKDLAGQQAAVDFGLEVNAKWLKHLAAVSAQESGESAE